MARRFWRAAGAVAVLATVAGLGVPAGEARAATGGYAPSAQEWWLANWKVPQKVWPLTEGAGVTVAMVGTGVQADIPDLRGAVVPGGDMIGGSPQGEQDEDSTDGHDTAMAVMVAGQGYGTGTVGIAPKAKILPVHVLYPGIGGPDATAKGIVYAVDHGAQVISLPLGTPMASPTACYPSLQDAVAYALQHNVVVVASSGDAQNGPDPEEPATCAGVVGVSGVEPNGSFWQGSVQGPNVAVAAPADYMVDVGRDGKLSHFTAGTSYSAPLVAGAAALIRSRYPSMPWYTVVQRLIDTALPVGRAPNNQTGYGIIDVFKAVDASAYPVPASSPDPPYTRYVAWLKSAAGQAWAQQNGVRVPGMSLSGTPAVAANPSSGSGGIGALVVVLIVVLVVVVAAGALAVVLGSRRRSARGLGVPGGFPPPAYPPNAYGPLPGQYPQGAYPQGQPPPGLYPSGPPGQYPGTPGQSPPGQYPPGQPGAYWPGK